MLSGAKHYGLVLRPKTRAIPETLICRIFVFSWSLGPLAFPLKKVRKGPSGGTDDHQKPCRVVPVSKMRLLCRGAASLVRFDLFEGKSADALYLGSQQELLFKGP